MIRRTAAVTLAGGVRKHRICRRPFASGPATAERARE